jgi:hypothetical protein
MSIAQKMAVVLIPRICAFGASYALDLS